MLHPGGTDHNISNYNRFAILSRVVDNISSYNLNNRNMLREVIVKIELERIDIQERVIVKALLNSGATGLVMRIC